MVSHLPGICQALCSSPAHCGQEWDVDTDGPLSKGSVGCKIQGLQADKALPTASPPAFPHGLTKVDVGGMRSLSEVKKLVSCVSPEKVLSYNMCAMYFHHILSFPPPNSCQILPKSLPPPVLFC